MQILVLGLLDKSLVRPVLHRNELAEERLAGDAQVGQVAEQRGGCVLLRALDANCRWLMRGGWLVLQLHGNGGEMLGCKVAGLVR